MTLKLGHPTNFKAALFSSTSGFSLPKLEENEIYFTH